MPSILLGNPLASGAQQIISGFPWSGRAQYPVGGVQFKVDKNCSGNIYIGLSGGMHIGSGGMFLSGNSGLLDGMQLGPGDGYFVPRLATGPSGNLNIWAFTDPACSGQARLYYEIY